MTDLAFEPISLFSPGELARIIGLSYAGLLEGWPGPWDREPGRWERFDREAFARPDTVGRCVFISRLDGDPAGLASYDPRPGPAYGIIGQNCVLPQFRGRGVGTRQIVEIIRRFVASGFGAARVTTSEHPFFLPARSMYQDLGFREIRRSAGGPDPRYGLIEMEKRPLV